MTTSHLGDGDLPALDKLLELLPKCNVVNLKGCPLRHEGIQTLAEMARKREYRMRFVVGLTPALCGDGILEHLKRDEEELVCLPLRSEQCAVRAFIFYLARRLGEVDEKAQFEHFHPEQLDENSLSAKTLRCMIKSFPSVEAKLQSSV